MFCFNPNFNPSCKTEKLVSLSPPVRCPLSDKLLQNTTGGGGSPGIWYVVETNFQKFFNFFKNFVFLSWQRCRCLFLAKAPHEQSVTKNANFFNTEIIEFRNIYRPIFFRGGGGRNNYYVVSRGGVSPNTSIYYKGEGGGKNPQKSHYVVCERPQIW
jgi:hypothetical protein